MDYTNRYMNYKNMIKKGGARKFGADLTNREDSLSFLPTYNTKMEEEKNEPLGLQNKLKPPLAAPNFSKVFLPKSRGIKNDQKSKMRKFGMENKENIIENISRYGKPNRENGSSKDSIKISSVIPKWAHRSKDFARNNLMQEEREEPKNSLNNQNKISNLGSKNYAQFDLKKNSIQPKDIFPNYNPQFKLKNTNDTKMELEDKLKPSVSVTDKADISDLEFAPGGRFKSYDKINIPKIWNYLIKNKVI